MMTKSFLLFLASGAFFAACTVDDQPTLPPNEEELITTVNVQLTSVAGSALLTFKDLDGPGGSDPQISGGTLTPHTEYSYNTTFLNESVIPASNITEEVRMEGTDHFVLFSGVSLDFAFTLGDMDTDGNAIGLKGTLTTMGIDTGELRVVLLHEPVKTATVVTGGETDVDVSFPILVE